MKKIIVLFLGLFVLAGINNAKAGHIVGGEITVQHVTGNDFEVALNFFRDCFYTTNDDSVQIGIYDLATNALVITAWLPKTYFKQLTLGDSCYSPPNLCVEHIIYKKTITIPNNPNGYYVVHDRCCRNNVIVNITNPNATGNLFYTEIPDPALKNSSPVFGSYPNAYMCVNFLNNRNFSATDKDGDVLVYSLVQPYAGNGTSTNPMPGPSPKPYPLVTWSAGYSNSNMVGGTPAMTINTTTGLITATPNALGVFVFAVKVEEFRNGIKIGEVRRDVQYQMLNCSAVTPPAIVTSNFNSTYSMTVGDSVCFTVPAMDSATIWLQISASSVDLLGPGNLHTPVYWQDVKGPTGTVQSQFCIKATCASPRATPYHIDFIAQDSSCYGYGYDSASVDITINPLPEGTLGAMPNVFTPNGDNVNDYFHVQSTFNPCTDSISIHIYNRWGERVWEGSGFGFKWDGKNKKGKEVPDGVYYYVLYAHVEKTDKYMHGFIQILR